MKKKKKKKKKRDARKHAQSQKAELVKQGHVNMQEHFRSVDDAVRPDGLKPPGEKDSTTNIDDDKLTIPDTTEYTRPATRRDKRVRFGNQCTKGCCGSGHVSKHKFEEDAGVNVDDEVPVAKASGQERGGEGEDSSSDTVPRGYICYICGESGHGWRDCKSPIQHSDRESDIMFDGKGRLLDQWAHWILDGVDPRTLLKYGMGEDMISNVAADKAKKTLGAAKTPVLVRNSDGPDYVEFDCAECGKQVRATK